jgi:hypothetical protein
MSLKSVEAQIRAFLKTDTPEILAIKGAWGVGKTFLWNKVLLEAKQSYRIALKQYAYVSLFGINSLDELKLTTFMQVGSVQLIGSEQDSISTINIDKLAMAWSRKGISLLKEIPYIKSLWSTTQALAFLSLQATLICIDDFERKGKGLDAQDVLGLMNLLKENRKCKIALIFNEEGLTSEHQDQFKKFREKVIDIELEFRPTSSECASIALADDPVSLKLKGHIETLGINNIRIIKKIARLANTITSHLSGLDERLINRALQSLTLFAWSHFSGTTEAPDYSFITKNDQFKSMWPTSGKEKEAKSDPKEDDWSKLLRRYGFLRCNDFDLEIAEIVKSGYIDSDSLLNQATKLNEIMMRDKSRAAVYAAWSILRESFDDNESQFIQELHRLAGDNIRYLDPFDLDQIVVTLRQFGHDAWADGLIQDFGEARVDDDRLFSLHKKGMLGPLEDKSLIQTLDDMYKSRSTGITVKDILQEIADKQGWDPEDEVVLSTASSDEYRDFFTNERGPHLPSFIDFCLKFGEYANPTPRQKKIATNVTNALKKIGGENRLNALRVRRYGIKVENSDKDK